MGKVIFFLERANTGKSAQMNRASLPIVSPILSSAVRCSKLRIGMTARLKRRWSTPADPLRISTSRNA